jgi:cell filamentation protein
LKFDVFGDFEERGYLRNFVGEKDLDRVKRLEHRAFLIKVETALTDLFEQRPLTYDSILGTHRTLFGSVYPWAGQDRFETAPSVNITRGGYDRMFAFPQDVQRATEYALRQGNDVRFMREKPGEVMGWLAHAHPFLDGNGRTIMTVHTVLAFRAGVAIAWQETEKDAYLAALTKELHLPGDGYLDAYLKPFVREAISHKEQAQMLISLKGLASSGHAAEPRDGANEDPTSERPSGQRM